MQKLEAFNRLTTIEVQVIPLNDYLLTNKLTTENGGVKVRVRNFHGPPREMHRRFEQIAVSYSSRRGTAATRQYDYDNANFPQLGSQRQTTAPPQWPRTQAQAARSMEYTWRRDNDYTFNDDTLYRYQDYDDVITLHNGRSQQFSADDKDHATTRCPSCTIL